MQLHMFGQDKDNMKLYYSIGEVSEMFKVSNSLIRFWETEFSILKPKKNSKGDRRYMKKDIDNLRIIYHLVKEKGYTLDGAKKEIQRNKERLAQKFKAIEALQNLKTFLLKLKEEL